MNKDNLVQEVFEKYKEVAEKDINLVPEPDKTLMVIYSAHGIIGNGGFRYFFENDFPGIENYNIIIKSYNNLNLNKHAEAIEKVLSLFPQGQPHKCLDERNKFMAKYFDDESKKYSPLVDWAEDIFFEDHSAVYDKAVSYYVERKA